MISRATSVYIIMLVIFGAGLWAILSFGSILLKAPTDLAGRWELQSAVAGADLISPKTQQMAVEQSGQYFRISMNGKPISLKRSAEHTLNNPKGPDQLTITLKGQDVELVFTGPPDAEEYQLQASGSAAPQGTWRATRTERLYPKRPQDKPATRPAPTTASTVKMDNDPSHPT